MIKAILTDIEGTTSSIDFVKQVLFPYAARHMAEFLQRHWQDTEVQQQIRAMRTELDTPIESPAQANQILQRWISEDRKATPLKTLQGMIWRHGYEQGDYRAHLYPDSAAALRRWHADDLALYVYSSGSIAAQKLFFRYSEAGDLSPLFSGYFDTTSGAKQAPSSYQAIAAAIGLAPADILFLSDMLAELDAARAAGMQTVQLDREGDAGSGAHLCVNSFSEITL